MKESFNNGVFSYGAGAEKSQVNTVEPQDSKEARLKKEKFDAMSVGENVSYKDPSTGIVSSDYIISAKHDDTLKIEIKNIQNTAFSFGTTVDVDTILDHYLAK